MPARTIIPALLSIFLTIGFSQYAHSDQQWESFNKKSVAEFSNPLFSLNLQPLAIIADNSVSTASNSEISERTVNDDTTTIKFDEPFWTLNNAHKYTGLAALGMVAIAMVAPKEEGGLHEQAAKAAAFLGSYTIASGLYVHWDDINFEEGFSDPDNLHALLAGLGAAAILLAASEGPDGGHAGIGAIGAVSMAIGIKLTW